MKTKTGNGKFDENKNIDKNIEGVQVDLVEIKDNEVRATTYTDSNGGYEFKEFLPGDYKVRFTYGYNEATVMTTKNGGANDTSYNGQDYQSTKYDKDKHKETYWYSKIDTENRMSDAEDTAGTIERVTGYARTGYGNAITNYKAEIFKSYIKGEKNQEFMDKTHRVAETEKMNIEIEYTTTNTPYSGYEPEYNIKHVDFGIMKRPKQELVIDQDVKHVKLTLENGTVLIDSDKEDGHEHIMWLPEDETKKDQKIIVTLDEELITGAKIEILYEITIKNNSEKGSGRTQAKGIINYVANNLSYNEDDNILNDKKMWEVVSKDTIQKDIAQETLINKNVNLDSQLVILKATKFNPLTKWLEPNETTTVQLKLTKILSAESVLDDLTYTNMTEIVEIDNEYGLYDYGAVPGNQDLSKQPFEHDTSGASRGKSGEIDTKNKQDGTVTVTPPTGSNYIYYTLAISTLLTFALGILAIKKFILKTK